MIKWNTDTHYWAPTRKGGGWLLHKDSPSPPPPPDYSGAAAAQGAANVETARVEGRMKNPNVRSPYGNQDVVWGDNDQATVTQTLTPQAQQTLNTQQAVQGDLANLGQTGARNAQGILSSPFSFGGQDVQGQIDTSGNARMPVNAGTTGQDAIMARLAPQQGRDRVSYETQLTNQGLRPGMEGWDNGMNVFNQGQNDAKTQAALHGLNLDMTANNQGFNQALQAGQFGNTAQNQQMAQAIQQRQMPINEITALMSGSQIQNPQFQQYQGANVAPPPIMQGAMAQGQAEQNAYNAQMAGNNAMTGGLFSLAGAGMKAYAMSDRRLKSNIVRIGTHPLGIGIYEYDIFGKRDVGVMADEVEMVKPSAVGTHISGFKMVDYGSL